MSNGNTGKYIAPKVMFLKVVGRRRAGYLTRSYLEKEGFVFHEVSTGPNYWSKQIVHDAKIIKKYKKKLSRKGLKLTAADVNYTRSSNYRNVFFSNNLGLFKKEKHYFCSYCGKIVSVNRITVDHLIPVKKASTHKRYQLLLKLFGAESVNNAQNLVAACYKCNQKKSAKGGLWVIRGVIGRHNVLWYIIYTIFGMSLIFVLSHLNVIIQWFNAIFTLRW